MTKDTLLALKQRPEASFVSETPTPTINTPPSEDSPYFDTQQPIPSPRRPSPLNLGTGAVSAPVPRRDGHDEGEEYHSELELEDEQDLMAERPQLHRPTHGRSHVPLLKDEERGRRSYDAPNGSARPPFSARSSTFRSRSPDFDPQNATRKKYIYAAFFLGLSLVSFVVQTETAIYIQHVLKWDKAYCML